MPDVENVAFLAFDPLCLRGRSLQSTPNDDRDEELDGLPFQTPVALSPRFDDGEALFEQTLRQGYEGIVAKRRRSMCHPSVRTRDWIKTKHWVVEEFVIRGWSPPRHRHGWGLLVGEIDEHRALQYPGSGRVRHHARCPGRVGGAARIARPSNLAIRAKAQRARRHVRPAVHPG